MPGGDKAWEYYGREDPYFGVLTADQFRRENRRPMPMNCYDLGRVFRMLREAGCYDFHVRFTEASHYGYPVYGALLHFAKRRLDVGRHS